MYDLIFSPDPASRSQSEPRQDPDTVLKQLYRYDQAVIAHNRWAEDAVRNIEFFEGRQWTDADRDALAAQGRPVVTINRIRPIVRMLSGYFRQNRYDIEFPPASTTPGSERASDVFGMLAKQVGERCGMPWVDAEVFIEGLLTGRGYYDARLCFDDNALGEVKICSVNPFDVLVDPQADSYDPREWNHVQTMRWMSIDDVQATYGDGAARVADITGLAGRSALSTSGLPDAGIAQVPIAAERAFGLFSYLEGNSDPSGGWQYAASGKPGGPFDWINRERKLLRVLETQHKVYADTMFVQDTETGEQAMVPLHMTAEYLSRIMQWAQSRGFPVRLIQRRTKLVRFTITCADVLLYDGWSPYRTFTIIPYFSYFRRGVTRGIVDDLIDPQREVNKRRSVYLHIVMTTANSGWAVEDGSVDPEMMSQLETEGSRPGLIVRYKRGQPAPQRIQPAVAPAALERLEQASTNDIKEISGVNDSALGNLDRVQSGRAIMARQRQGIVGNEDVFDNHARTLELLGYKQLELFQGFYTQQRVMRLKDKSGQAKPVVLNGPQPDDGEVIDITRGSFQVAVDVRPMAATFEQAGFEDLKEIVASGIIPGQLVADIVVDASSAPRKADIKERLSAAQQAAMEMEADALQAGIVPGGEGGSPPPRPPAAGGTPENP